MFKYDTNTVQKIKKFSVNFGPQHPAAHGVLRLNLLLSNERILACDPHIGLLHRNTEFLITTKKYQLSLPYFDRLDYVSMLSQEHAYTLCIEKLFLKKKTTFLVQQVRCLLEEITRILNHLLALACHALDIGSMSIIFWSFEERENCLSIYETISGARMHTSVIRPTYSDYYLNNQVMSSVLLLCNSLPVTITEINSVLNLNVIWKIRLKNVGVLSLNEVNSYGLSGVLARSIGLKLDLRQHKKTTYSFYKFLNFFSFFTHNGDSLDRYNIRLYEIIESLNIVNSILVKLFTIKNKSKKRIKTMENIIHKFKEWSDTTEMVSSSPTSFYLESPKGSFGLIIEVSKNNFPVFCKIRSPSFVNLFLLKNLSKGLTLADLITLIGTIDIVFGEIDR